MPLKPALISFALGALACAPWLPAHGQSTPPYPTKPIRFVVPYPPAAPPTWWRAGIGLALGPRLGQQVVVDNRGGASTIIGAEVGANAAPDGYTLLLVTQTTLSINPNVFPKLPYDAARDFAAITPAVYFPYVIAAHPSVRANSVKELIELAKAKPGTIKYSTPGTASTNHLAGAQFESMTGTRSCMCLTRDRDPRLPACSPAKSISLSRASRRCCRR